MNVLRWLVRLGLAVLFAWAGASKLGDPAAFADDIANYRIVPTLAPLAAATLPTVELVTAAALVLAPRTWRAAAALLALALLLLFTAAVGAAWARGLDIRCGCFGTGGGPVTGLVVMRDVGLVAIAGVLLLLERR